MGVKDWNRTSPPIWKWPLGTLLILTLTLGADVCCGDRTGTKIYQPILGSYPCFRKLNGTHQVGCSSSLSGDVGVAHLVEDEQSLNWILRDGPHSPYIALLYPDSFNQSVMSRFKRSDRVAGVLVLNTTKSNELKKFSPDLKCPNFGFGMYKNPSSSFYCEKWNAPWEGLLYERFDFPMFFVMNENDSKIILDCYEKFNRMINGTERDWPLCAAQLKSFMAAAVDTPTCMRRSDRFNLEQQKDRVCDPMGDLNLWTSILPSNQSLPYDNNAGSVIVISARLDSASMFDTLARGADGAATGVVTLLSVLKQLSKLKDIFESSTSKIRNVYFILFHGESFGYIGSSRMVYDMKNGNFPDGIGENDTDVAARLNLTDIKYYIEIGQVGLTDANAGYFIHEANSTLTSDLSSSLVNEGGKLLLKVDISKSTKTMGLPPCSLQSFLAENSSIPGLLVSNHEAEFRNQFYSSVFDDATRLQYNYKGQSVPTIKIADLAATISSTVLKLFDPQSTVKVDPDPELVDELLHCYIVAGNCSLFQRMAGHTVLPPTPFDLYVGVDRHHQTITYMTRYLMMYFQGTNTTIRSEKECKTPDAKRNVDYQWINGSCFETTVNTSQAQSPAFVIDNYDWKSGQYSTWAESVWQQFSVRVFLKPSRSHEIITLVSGIVVFLISFAIVGWVSSKADIIFPTRGVTGMTC